MKNELLFCLSQKRAIVSHLAYEIKNHKQLILEVRLIFVPDAIDMDEVWVRVFDTSPTNAVETVPSKPLSGNTQSGTERNTDSPHFRKQADTIGTFGLPT